MPKSDADEKLQKVIDFLLDNDIIEAQDLAELLDLSIVEFLTKYRSHK